MTRGLLSRPARHRTASGIIAGVVVFALLAWWAVDRLTRTTPATLTVLTPWTDTAEMSAFQAVVDAFEDATHHTIQVDVESSRDEDEVLQSGIQDGDPPNLAVLPNPGALKQYVSQGYVTALDKLQDGSLQQQITSDLTDDFGRLWNQVIDAGTTDPYAVVVKAAVKSLIWHGPGATRPAGPLNDWGQLLAQAGTIAGPNVAPWCIGLSDVSTAGWPGTDWIEDILLHQTDARTDAQTYDSWVDGTTSWTSDQVSAAWQSWGQLLSGAGQVYGGDLNALAMPAGDTDDSMFAPSGPGCAMSHGAGLETSGSVTAKPGEYGYFAFPGAALDKTYEVSADVMGIFDDTPQAEQFAAFLASVQGQTIWPARQPDSAFSADIAADAQSVLSADYAQDKDEIAPGIEGILTDPQATLCYDASDLMPPTMEAAFERAVLEYVADPSSLPSILSELNTVQKAAYADYKTSGYQLTACGPGIKTAKG